MADGFAGVLCELATEPCDGRCSCFKSIGVELRGCSVTVISCAAIGAEKITSMRPEGWPPAVRERIELTVADWVKHHPDRLVRLLSLGATRDVCFMAVHHALRPGENATP